MNLEEKEDFLGRWADGRLSEDEQKAFESTEDYSTYQKILTESSSFVPSSFNTEKALIATKGKLAGKNRSKFRSIVPVWSVAAALALLFISYFLFTGGHTVETGFGELSEEVLPDGSIVRMNAKTELTYRKRNWKENRRISLNGEAYFEVAKGATFTVESLQGEVQVLGTKFNVYSRENIFEVRCFEGKVKVSGAGETFLSAGESYRQVADKVERVELPNDESPEWINRETSYKNSPVGSVLLGLANQYGLSFEGNVPVDSIRVTVSFPNDNEELALDLVFKSLQKNYYRKSEKVIFID